GVGAPHIRQRLFWVAYAVERRRQESRSEGESLVISHQDSPNSGVADTKNADREWSDRAQDAGRRSPEAGRSSSLGRLADTQCDERGADKSWRQSEGRAVDWR